MVIIGPPKQSTLLRRSPLSPTGKTPIRSSQRRRTGLTNSRIRCWVGIVPAALANPVQPNTVRNILLTVAGMVPPRRHAVQHAPWQINNWPRHTGELLEGLPNLGE